jgi:hypothetical protein
MKIVKKISLFTLFVLISHLSISQMISGDLLDSGRKLETNFNFEIHDKYVGIQHFELAVNPLGKVIGIKHLEEKGTMLSTPAKILATNKLYELQFESGTNYPKFHHVKVKVKFIKNIEQ